MFAIVPQTVLEAVGATHVRRPSSFLELWMKRLATVAGLALALAASVSAFAQTSNEEQKAVVIPLKQIWGYEMPATRDIRELEPKRDERSLTKQEFILGSPVNHIVAILSKPPKVGEKAGPGFVVIGTGKEALGNAHAVFAEKKKPENELPKDKDLSLVVFSYLRGAHFEIKSVEKSKELIKVGYRFVHPMSQFGAARFALIPIGKLPTGKLQVRMTETPAVNYDGTPGEPISAPERSVSGSFSFNVR